MNAESTKTRHPYEPPRMTSYDESQVADQLGPVMLSGTGTQLQELQGETAQVTRMHVSPQR